MKHFRPHKLKIIVSIDGNDEDHETAPGYSEQDAYRDILSGDIEDVEQILRITADGCEDITAQVANLVAGAIEFGYADDFCDSTKAFAERFGGYVPPRNSDDFFDRADWAHDRAN